MTHDWPPQDVALSPREEQIVELIAQGLTNAEIAARLSLRPQSVKNRLSEIFQKTGLRSRTALAVWSLRREALRPS